LGGLLLLPPSSELFLQAVNKKNKKLIKTPGLKRLIKLNFKVIKERIFKRLNDL
jgi:hypothetical protein